MHIDAIKNKRVLVVGLGVTGESVVRFLHAHQIAFDVVDERTQPSEAIAKYLDGATVHTALNAELCCDFDVLVLSPGVPRALPALQVALDKGVLIIGDIELFADAIGDAQVIAVTGSNGKSTVVSWIAHVLAHCGKRARLCGNIGVPALDSLADDTELYVLELSSYQLESTASLKSLSAVVLNISDDHMDRYQSIEHYADVKRRVYDHCANRVFNFDDKRTWTGAEARTGGVMFSLEDNNDADYHLRAAANDAWLCRGNEQWMRRSQLQTPGDHNVANALAVLALLEPIGLNKDQLTAGLAGFHGLEHRTEFVKEGHGVRWYNDSKGTNIDACEKAILAMNAPVVLIAGGLGKGADFQALRPVVMKHVKALVLIGKDANIIADALESVVAIVMATSMIDAVERCAALAEHGDVVLLSPACSSFDMFDSFEHRGREFKQAVAAVAA